MQKRKYKLIEFDTILNYKNYVGSKTVKYLTIFTLIFILFFTLGNIGSPLLAKDLWHLHAHRTHICVIATERDNFPSLPIVRTWPKVVIIFNAHFGVLIDRYTLQTDMIHVVYRCTAIFCQIYKFIIFKFIICIVRLHFESHKKTI